MAGGGTPRFDPFGWFSDLLGLLLSVGGLAGAKLFIGDEAGNPVSFLLLPALLLLCGAFGGRLAVRMHLPKLTGYILIGVLVGPYVPFGLFSEAQVKDIKLVEDLAIGLIALMAGAEIRVSWLRERIKSVLVMVAAQTLVVPALVMSVVLFFAAHFAFMQEVPTELGRVLPALLLGLIALANSPMVVVSVIKEEHAAGALSETAMGVAVLKDAVVILAFTLLVALLANLEGGGGASAGLFVSTGGTTLLALFASVLLGLPIGFFLAWLTERDERRMPWLVVGAALAVALLEPLIHIKPLFCLLTAGFACENLYRKRSAWGRHHLERSLSQVAAPVFVIFFVAAGLGLDLQGIGAAWLAVVLLTLTRIGSYWIGLEAGCRLSGVEPRARRYLLFGVIPQAGVTLGLAAIVGATFPGWGEQLRDILIACVALHELIGPVLWTWALKRTGEAGAADGGGGVDGNGAAAEARAAPAVSAVGDQSPPEGSRFG